jgi:transcriptional regulator with PAS, ATPase and Fis domain
MVAGAKGIEAQRQADVLLAEQNSQLAQLNVIMDAISEGIVVWNEHRQLIHINNYAAQLFGIPIQRLVGRSFGSLATYPHFLVQAIEKCEPLTDVEANLKIGEKNLNCMISVRFVVSKEKLEWIIMTMRPIREVRQLVQRQVGAQALMSLDDIAGESAQIKRVRHFVRSTAAAGASILIRGESGTGKNALARAIHNESPRREGPFLIFPCASMPGELVLNELLGYEEGPYPKRSGSRPSKFELAQGGTIYFQDVDMLPLEAQSMLLNVLELGVIQRLGSERPTEVDVRVIASTSAKIEKNIATSSFRSDLFYRLSTFSINLPALRERPQDIPLIAERILKRLSRQLDRSLEFGPGVVEALKKYSWPGNIRELEAVLGMAVAQLGSSGSGKATMVELGHISATVRYLKRHTSSPSSEILVQSMDEVERDAIVQAARQCHGNTTRMAQVLGLGRTTLWRKMKRHKILLEDYRKNTEEIL